MLELKKKSPNRGYTTDPVHIAEVGAGVWGMLPFSTKAIGKSAVSDSSGRAWASYKWVLPISYH